MLAMSDHDAETDAIVAMLEQAGLVEQHVDPDGKPVMRLTKKGEQLGRSMALAGEEADADAVLEALVGDVR